MKQAKTFMRHLLLGLAGLVSAISAKAANYDFKAENSDGVIIYYTISGDSATVVAGDAVYTGVVDIPSTVVHENIRYTVTAIGDEAFRACKGLTAVEIPASVVTIGRYAFAECTALTGVMVPASVRKIGGWAFLDCSGLSDIAISEGVELIYAGTFKECKSLTTITLPKTLRRMGMFAFWGTGIKVVYAKMEQPSRIPYAFDDDTKDVAAIYIPAGTKKRYQSVDGWDFANMVEADAEVSTEAAMRY